MTHCSRCAATGCLVLISGDVCAAPCLRQAAGVVSGFATTHAPKQAVSLVVLVTCMCRVQQNLLLALTLKCCRCLCHTVSMHYCAAQICTHWFCYTALSSIYHTASPHHAMSGTTNNARHCWCRCFQRQSWTPCMLHYQKLPKRKATCQQMQCRLPACLQTVSVLVTPDILQKPQQQTCLQLHSEHAFLR